MAKLRETRNAVTVMKLRCRDHQKKKKGKWSLGYMKGVDWLFEGSGRHLLESLFSVTVFS